jgi:hypothetical protein
MKSTLTEKKHSQYQKEENKMINENSTKEIVLEAVKHNGYALGYASKKLQNDREVVLEAVREAGDALKYASEELQNDREVVLKALKDTRYAFEYASDSIQYEIAQAWIKSMEQNK